ncbi:MAG: AcvB/VirJ family lysyl-phosphatidylglycerol hydrolase [Pseudoxanthomonas sp.]
MSTKTWGRWTLIALLLILGTGAAVATHLRDGHLGKPFGQALTFKPQGAPRGVAVLLGDRAAPDTDAARLADTLARQGLLVAVVPAGDALRQLDGRHCEQVANDAERVAKRLMRWDGVASYFEPVLVGVGPAGSALAHAAVSHALPQTVAGAVLMDSGQSTAAPACSMRVPSPEQGFVLQADPLASDAVITSLVMAHLPRPSATFRGLPLVELPALGSHRLVIFMSGDGGWRALDKGVSSGLRDQGTSVVGWDSLRYFWSRRTPQQTANDLAAVIDAYSTRWHTDDVELVGYSFGADAMPFLYNRLPPATRAKVRSLSLLGLGHGASFKVSVGGWLGTPSSDDAPVAPELASIPSGKLLCVFGQDEKDTLCPGLAVRGVTVAQTKGGHHFDGDLPAMVQRLEHHFQRNDQAGPNTASDQLPARG